MNSVEEIMTDIYNTLVQIRYPKITTAAPSNVESTILNGENRVLLLSWLLAEKSPSTGFKLGKLKGVTLEEELLKHYSEIGICTDKKLLLGNCPLEEQLPTLRLLLDFIKCIFIESSDIEETEEDSTVDEIFNTHINEDSNTIAGNLEPKLSYSESMQYFNNIQKYINEHDGLHSTCENGENEQSKECQSIGKENKETYRSSLCNETQKFVEAFSSIHSWPTSSILDATNAKNNSYSLDADINDIYSNFSSFTQFLQAKEEILNANIPNEINKLNTLLDKIIEECVMHTEEAINLKFSD
ncbi:uncharacterized protein LOC143422959 [Xylocopa sonorina]|uniref:uncharacterized protein LOC143422959 n=1 Tax=Xylocopa sonorina TaxID=1818115 RepID=UPI00403AE6BC